MHLRHGHTAFLPSTTPIARHLPRRHLRPPRRSFLWMPLPRRAPSRPPPVGRAQRGTARMKTRINTSRAVTSHNKVPPAHRTKKSSSPHTCLALNPKLIHLLKLFALGLDRTRGEPNVLTHTNYKMERLYHHALDHHHLWCDKANGKRILSTVLLVS